MYGIHVRSLPWILVILCFLPCDVNAAQQVLNCGGNFTAASGTIQSPGHPGDYTNNLDCVYVIRRPQGERITLTFEQLDMPGRGVECTEDFLEIRDGDSANSPILARVCNTSLPSPKRTFQNKMWIRFRSDGAVTGRGFRTSYTSGIMKEKFLLIANVLGNIFNMDVESGSRTALPLPGLKKPIAVDYDPVEGRLYWTDFNIREIKSAYLNGSGIRSVRVFNANADLNGMAVDPLSRLVFYTDQGNGVIGMMGLSGTPHKTVIITNLDKPWAIVLDTMNGVMFWTDVGTQEKIERANYDGTDHRTLHSYNLIFPIALAVDLKNNRLYWVDAGTTLVEWSELDGTSRTQLYKAKGGAVFFGMTYSDNMLYVTDLTTSGSNTTNSYLHILSTDGSMGETVISVPGKLFGIHMYVEDGWQRGPNGCGYNNGGCSHICIPASGNSSKCLCPDTPTVCREAAQQVSNCGGNFTAASGTIQSPGYPGNYTNNLDCVYVIRRPQGERITLTFELLDMPGRGVECTEDFLEIRDGDSANFPVLARVCNTSLPSPKRTFQNHMWIRFRSDGVMTGRGFKTSYTSGIIKEKFFFIACSLGKIFHMDVESGSSTALPLPSLYNPIGVDYDPVEGRLYWTDVIIRQILSAYLNGSDSRSLRVFSANAVLDGMAVDPLSRLVFYTDEGNDVIGMMGLSGTPHKTVISTNLDKPRAIVLDTMNGVMFWTDWGRPAKIERANYDGTDRRTLHSYFLIAPNALAVDLKKSRLYWADAGTDLVEWSDLDGTSRTQLYKVRGEAHLFGMTYYDNMLYVTDWTALGSNTNNSYVHKLRTDGSMGETIGSVPGRLNGIHMYVEDGWQKGPNGCGYNNGGCSHICVPAYGNSSKCLCPDTPTLCREVSGSSTTTQPVTSTTTTITTSTTSTTSTSKSPPIEVTIQGPTLFDTDGSKAMNLTCDPENRNRVRSVTWSVTCTMQVDRKCVWTPRPPGNDGTVVTCSVAYINGQSGVGSFRVQLNYPPSEPPMIHGYNTGDVLKAGDSLTMACLVRDGKPLVTSVIFSCPGHPDSVKDIRSDSAVQSLVVINPLRASDNGVRCVCTADWKRSEWYALSATRVLSVEGASTTTGRVTSTTSTASTTSTTSTSTPSPTQVTIEGPSLFDTDGSETMTLTCDLENRKRVRSVTWSVTCTIQDDRKCMWTPRPPEDDGKVVTCSITYIDGQSGVGFFRVQLNYPPSAPPMIHGYNIGDVVQAGDTLMMTCLVRDGKPLVTSVIFSCPGHPDNVKDIRGDTEVESLVVINPLRASDNGVRCVCTADWKRSEWYALSATRVLSVEGTISLPAEADQKSTKYIVGGAVGGGAFLLVVVVIIVVVICRRGGNNYERHASDYPAPDVELYPFARVDELGFLGNPCPARPPAAGKDEDTNSTYAEIVEEHCKGEKPAKSDYDSVRPSLPSARPPQENYDRLNGKKPVSKSTHPSEPADDYLHPAKSDSDYLHPATPADDYMHPVKPRAETDTDNMHSANPADDYLHPVKPRAPDSDDLHLANPADDYLHPVKPRAKPHSDYLHSANPADDYLHPVKPRTEPHRDYLHSANPADDYLHPIKPRAKADSD